MLSNKNIVVTGCLQGIGRETALVAAQNGANVFACAYKETEEYKEFCQKTAEDNRVEVIPVYFDMMDNDSIKQAVKTIQGYKMDIHGLINVAGINRDALFGMITASDMQDTFQVNIFSQIILSQYISKLMLRKNVEGSIAFVSSIAGLDGNEGQVTYAASKAALLGVMRSMAKELGEKKIRVNAVCPGVIKTPMTDVLPEEIKQSNIDKMDIKRLGTPTEVANTLVFLMSDYSSHMTGQTIRIDGGMR